MKNKKKNRKKKMSNFLTLKRLGEQISNITEDEKKKTHDEDVSVNAMRKLEIFKQPNSLILIATFLQQTLLHVSGLKNGKSVIK